MQRPTNRRRVSGAVSYFATASRRGATLAFQRGSCGFSRTTSRFSDGVATTYFCRLSGRVIWTS